MRKLIMALDQGTTSSRCILFNENAKMIESEQIELTQIYPQPGWVEHDPIEIYESIVKVINTCLDKIDLTKNIISAIGITNQRETTIVWDKHSGEPVCPAIVWQCRRTSDKIATLIEEGYAPMIKEKTGLQPDAYFSASKIEWILENIEGASQKAQKGELLFGTVETWLIWKLSGGSVHISDYTNASRTMLFNIHTLQWDSEICELFHIPMSLLPTPVGNSEIYTLTNCEDILKGIPIAGAMGDQQAALFGQCCFERGDCKNTYGTGAFLLMNTDDTIIDSKAGLLSTIASNINGKIQYALEGSVFISGAAVQWLRDELLMIEKASDTEKIALEADDCGSAYIVPAFTGLGAPYWNSNARGMIVGMTRGFDRKQFVRATLESIAYQTNDVLKAMEEDIKDTLVELTVDGGASENQYLMQFQADISNIVVKRAKCIESTALGVVYLAGLAVGVFESKDQLKRFNQTEFAYPPIMNETQRLHKQKGWKKAIDLALCWNEN